MPTGKKHITYDSTNQLVSAANPQTYALSVTYGPWGKIQQYGLSQTDLASNTTTSQTRYYSYGSLNEGQTTFAPNSINYADGTNVNEQYGIGGSLQRRETTIPNSTPSEELYRFGADGNLRLYSYDRLFFALYGYDGGTTRTYKYSFDLNPNWVNGRLESVNFNMHNAMFYPNAYINFNNNGYYTKHYYNGMERIASRLGDQNLPINVNDPELQDRKEWQDSLIRKSVVEITGYEFLPVGEEQTLEDPKPIYELPVIGISNLQPSSDGIYYYHSNHLGSTCYVTNENATVQQGFLYAPFGEITNEYNSGWQNGNIPKYAFNAKELDEETGMYYYEARYYAPPVFISRDPLFEKYPTFSPYAYCANNPVKYLDPDGREVWPTDEDAYQAILGTIPVEAREYVKLNEEGFIDKNLMESYSSNSQNFNDLLEMVKSDCIIEISIASSYSYINSDGEECSYDMASTYSNPEIDAYYSSIAYINFVYTDDGPYVLSTKETGTLGVTQMPETEAAYRSTNDNVCISINNRLSSQGRAENLAHEFYGHAYLYILTGSVALSTHKFKGYEDLNIVLKNRIITSTNEIINIWK